MSQYSGEGPMDTEGLVRCLTGRVCHQPSEEPVDTKPVDRRKPRAWIRCGPCCPVIPSSHTSGFWNQSSFCCVRSLGWLLLQIFMTSRRSPLPESSQHCGRAKGATEREVEALLDPSVSSCLEDCKGGERQRRASREVLCVQMQEGDLATTPASKK